MEKFKLDENIVELSPPRKVEMADEWFEVANTNHFWIRWRFEVLRKYTSTFLANHGNILEIGCGSGVVMNQFEQLLNKVIDGCDLNLYALKRIKNANGKKYVYNIFDLNEGMVGRYDTVILLDVVEHIENDLEFLFAARKHAKVGGYVVINVPAMNSLFSRYDEQAGHQRRYTKKMLKVLCEQAGLDVISIQYWGFSLIPVAIIRKVLLLVVASDSIIEIGFKPPSAWINKMFQLLMKVELFLVKSPPVGTSLFAVAKIRD